MQMFTQDTIAAISTPPGEGGIAIVRVSGPDAHSIGARTFLPARRGEVSGFAGYSVHYGVFVDAETALHQDDGLMTVFRAPCSYTGEDTVELACHGGRATTGRILQLVLAAGARLAEPGEFTRRAFFNGKFDLAQAEAVADVIRARTEAARRMARRQLDGALSDIVQAIKQELIGIIAAVEVTIDFSEEVGELDHGALKARISDARCAVEDLLMTADRGRILREGLRVAIIGRPNVGKSSLLNALLRTERSIVTEVAGTTRDLVEETANVRGVPVVLMDTAGMRETEDVVEGMGVERARNAAMNSDLTLLVIDATQDGISVEDMAIVRQLEADDAPRAIVVVNKCDAVTEDRKQGLVDEASLLLSTMAKRVVAVSAKTGQGLAELETALLAVATGEEADAANMEAIAEAEDTVVVSSARHRQALEAACRGLVEAERTAAETMPGDFIVIDVRGALDALMQITGETVTDDIIHRIFQDFCVGK